MSTFRTAFMQNYSSGNVFLSLFTPLCCLINSLFNQGDTPSIEDKTCIQPKCTVETQSFKKYQGGLCLEKEGSSHASTRYTNSLSQILDNNSSDFKIQREEGSLVHALEFIADCSEEITDVETVESCILSEFEDEPNSTESSYGLEQQLSDLEDF